MQPAPHMSTAVVYLLLPRRISGARYQRVAIYSVSTIADMSSSLVGAGLIERARPKSATFMRQSELRSRFDGFMSRCSRLAECMNLSALSVCHMMYCLWTSCRMFASNRRVQICLHVLEDEVEVAIVVRLHHV